MGSISKDCNVSSVIFHVLRRAVTHLSRQIFLALDPISAMHMGLSNDPEEQYRAELLSHFILRKIPNTLLESDTGGEIFQQKHESVKYEQAKKAREEPEPEPEPEHGGFSPREEDAVHAFSEGESLARVPFAAQSEDAWAQKEGSKAGEAAGRVSGGQGLWQQAKVAPLAADQAMGVEDFESAALPVVNKPKAHSSAPSSAVFSPAGGFDRDTASALPPLNELFCDPEMYRFRTMGLSLADSIAAHACLVRAGCTSTEELVAYLDDHKQSQRLCACRPLGSSTESNKSEQAHEAQCSTRQAGAWTPALTTTGIPAFHARKIIVSLKAFLA